MTAAAHSTQAALSAAPPLHRIVASGQMRYWIIASWALALGTTVHWRTALMWFLVTTGFGIARTFVDTRLTGLTGSDHGRLKLAVAMVSCIAWAFAPLLAYYGRQEHALAVAVALLMAGYTLVFTQARADPRTALVVSLPYTVVVLVLLADLWRIGNALTLLAMAPVLGLALLIKVVVTQIKDAELAAVNASQAGLILDLASARDRANAASEAKSNFLGIISHELRTPMNGVLGAAQLLQTTRLDASQANYVSIIRQSGEGLLVHLNDILDLTKIEAGRLDLAPTPTSTTDLLDRLIGPFRAQAEAKGLDFRVERSGEHPALVRLDPLRLAQITHNLLGNAVKFTESGEIRVSTEKRRLADDRMLYRFSVTDTGAGIAEHDLARLFQPFSQVDASSTRRFGGTGLGLSICRRLARLMGGEVSVVSVPDVGSTFTLEIEAEVLGWEAEACQTEEVGSAEEGAPLRVLVVEDHPVNRMVLEAWLASLGHGCVTAENGEIALTIAAGQRFDLIVMDVNMPVMDGLTATRSLRAGASLNRNTPIAVLSASARPEDHALGYAAGADAYVDKPVDFQALAAVMTQARLGRDAVRALPDRRAA